MGFLESLGAGLRSAGGIMDEGVFRGQRQEEAIQQQLMEKRKDMMAQQLFESVKSGATPPEVAKPIFEKLGLGGMTLGPSLDAQKHQLALRKEEVKKAYLARPEIQALINADNLKPVFQGLVGLGIMDPLDAAKEYRAADKDKREGNKPIVVGRGGIAISPTGETIAENPYVPAPPAPPAPSELNKLIRERDALHPGDPTRRIYDQKIYKLTTRDPIQPVQRDTPHAIVGVDENGNQVINWARPSQGTQTLASKPASLAGGGNLEPETLNFVAKQYLRGDRQAIQGFARNSGARIALQNEIVAEARRQGMSPEQTAAQMADFAGTVAGSRTVGQRAANISLAATEAQEMLGLVKQTSDKFSRTQFVPWNMALRAYETNTGDPKIAEFGASVNALVNVYARAINPTGVPTVSDKEHARAVLNTVQSPQQVDAVLGIINRELEIAKKAPSTVREATRAGIVGSQQSRPSTPQSRTPPPPPGFKVN